MKRAVWLLAALAAAGPAWTAAQTSIAPTEAPVANEAAPAVVALETDNAMSTVVECCVVPAGSTLELEIAQALNSAVQKRGDRFAITLHAPLVHKGVVVIPAGTAGMGEVVHADKSRGGGKPGELLIAARYLELDGAQIPLRGLKFGGQGQDTSKVALGVAMAIGPFAHFIRGKEIEIPAGTLVTAKLAQDFPVSAPSSDQSIPSISTATQQE
ncbi:MAG TPA: hypothetical protein VFR30_05700 [Lysobacter sp.]|nr:hypothetical protein [Lysobacter sp.]